MHGSRLYVVDTAHHRVVAFDTGTLEKVAQYPPTSWHRCSQGKQWDQLNNPQDVAAYEGEVFTPGLQSSAGVNSGRPTYRHTPY